MISLGIEGEGADVFVFFLGEFPDASGSIQIDLFSEANCKLALAAPVQKIEIVVITDFGCIENLFWGEMYLPLGDSFLYDFAFFAEEVLDC